MAQGNPASPTPASEAQVYVGGAFLPRSQAHADIEDRGTLFGDGVYEVLRVYFGRPLALGAHIERLRRSLEGIRLPAPADVERMGELTDELLRRNNLHEAKVYWQITRGAGPREHGFPSLPRPNLLMTAAPLPPLAPASGPGQIKAITLPDERWHNCWIKSLMLLPNVLARQRAIEAGAGEAIMHRDGRVTEGTTSSVLVVRDGVIFTHPADRWILPSVTRALLLEEARQAGMSVREESFDLEALRAAQEVMVANTTANVAAVVTLDGQSVGDGRVGPVALRLHDLLRARILRECRGA